MKVIWRKVNKAVRWGVRDKLPTLWALSEGCYKPS